MLHMRSKYKRYTKFPAVSVGNVDQLTIEHWTGKREQSSVEQPTTIVGHLAPDLDCLTAIWILLRFGGAKNATLQFVPAGATLQDQPPDADPRVIHVDTGGGRFDHHQRNSRNLCAAELVRRATAHSDVALKR